MKRSAALAPLSRDHHVALVIARELARAAEADAEAAQARFVRFLGEHELAHFALEESVLLPALREEPSGPELARRMLEDHEWLRAAMRRLRGSADAASVEYLHAVGKRLRGHVQMEERELFPYLEEVLDAAALEEIGSQLAREPDVGPAGVVRRFLGAIIDRDADALFDLADPRIELHPLRLTSTPAYQGHEGIRRWLDDLAQRTAGVSFKVGEIRGVDAERVIAHVQLWAFGDEVAGVTAVFTVRSGKVLDVHGYFSDEDLLAEVGRI
jgi:hemerythrin-like domain-containing protein